MKVAIINKSDKTGGAAVAAMRLANALNKNQIETTVFVQEKLSDNPIVQEVRFPLFNSLLNKLIFFAEAGYYFMFAKSRSMLFKFSPGFAGGDNLPKKKIKTFDVLHLHWVNQGFLSLGGIKELFELNKPMVWTLHDMWLFTGGCHYAGNCTQFESGCHNCPMTKRKQIFNLAEKQSKFKHKLLKNKNITIVTCSNWLKNEAIKSQILKGITVVNIPNPIDTSVFYPKDKTETRKQFNLPENKQLILFGAANIQDERKGYKYFTEALQLLHDDLNLRDKVEIVFFGKVDAASISLPFPVRILNYLSNTDQIANLYSAVDLFVIPSLEDNLPNTIMESMACGTPVAAFATGGIPEMIDSGDNGYLATYKSAEDLAIGIKTILSSSEIEKYGKAAVEKVHRCFSEKIVAERYREVYESVIQKQSLWQQ